MENNNAKRELRFRLLFYANVKGEKKFFVSPNTNTNANTIDIDDDEIPF